MRGSVGMMTDLWNIGLFVYPLVEAIWPSKGMIYFEMVDIDLGPFSLAILHHLFRRLF